MINIIPQPVGTITVSQFALWQRLDMTSAQIILDQLVENGDISPPTTHQLFVGPINEHVIEVYSQIEVTSQVSNSGTPVVGYDSSIPFYAEKSGVLNDDSFEWVFGVNASPGDPRLACYNGQITTMGAMVNVAPALGDTEIALTINNVDVETMVIPNGMKVVNKTLYTPIDLNMGDQVNLRTVTGSNAADACAAILFRVIQI